MLEDKRMERHDVIVRDPSAFNVGLDLVDKLFASLRASVGRRLEHPLLNNMLAVTLAAASLVMAYYELRNLTRGLSDQRRTIPVESLRRAACYFRVSSQACERCLGFAKAQRTHGDFTEADLPGLRDEDQACVRAALAGRFSPDIVEAVARAQHDGHGLAKLAADRLRETFRKDAAQLRLVVDRLAELLECETVDLHKITQLIALVDADDNPALADLSTRDQFLVYLNRLRYHNHLGTLPQDLRFLDQLRNLRSELVHDDPVPAL
jgi:hypothetical protein